MDVLFHILNQRLGLSDGNQPPLSDITNFQRESHELERCMASADRIYSAFQRHRNSLRMVNKLPDKVLTYIFELTKSIHERPTTFPVRMDPALDSGSFSTALGWIKVSWICQRWREVALSSPSLWADVLWKIEFYPHVSCGPDHQEICKFRFKVKPNVETTDMSIAFLQRSGGEPLQIKQLETYKESKDRRLKGSIGEHGHGHTCYGLPPNPFYDALRLQTHRIQTWDIRTAYIVQENIWGLLTLSFPIISEFLLKVDSEVNSRIWEDVQANTQGSLTPTPRYSFPMLFGQREVPTLRKFSIWRYSRWPHNSFPNLTHLSLNEQYVDFRPSVDEFLNMLESTPLLQYLHMDLAGPLFPRDFVPPARMIHLLHLKHIELHWRIIEDLERQYPPLLMRCLQMSLDVEIMYLAPQVLDDEEDLDLDLPPKKYMENITNLKVLVNGTDQFCLKDDLLRIETSSFNWFFKFPAYLPNVETLLFLSDARLNSKFPNFINLKHIHIAITDGLVYLMRVFAHPVPCCINLEDLTVHGRADPTKDIDDATEMERQTVETMLREGEVVVTRRLHRRSYRLISEKNYLGIYSFEIRHHIGWRKKGPFMWHYKYDIRDESLYH